MALLVARTECESKKQDDEGKAAIKQYQNNRTEENGARKTRKELNEEKRKRN